MALLGQSISISHVQPVPPRGSCDPRHMLLWVILLLGFCSLLEACSNSTPSSTRSARFDGSAIPPNRFSVLTYNVLHGLDVGRVWVRPGESAEDRTKRFKLQFQHLAGGQPDVVLLQEVNPLPAMAEVYLDGLKGFGLQYSAVHQADACGIRLGSKLGLVPGLNNGLAVLAKSPLRLRKLTGLKLSGGIGGCGGIIGERVHLARTVWNADRRFCGDRVRPLRRTQYIFLRSYSVLAPPSQSRATCVMVSHLLCGPSLE